MNLIALTDPEGGIAREGKLFARCGDDLARFRKLTQGRGKNAIIMGRTTWETIPRRPLQDRFNVVLSRREYYRVIGGYHAKTLEAALAICAHCEEVWIIGGKEVYQAAWPLVTRLELSRAVTSHGCDLIVPELISPPGFALTQLILSHNGAFHFETWHKDAAS